MFPGTGPLLLLLFLHPHLGDLLFQAGAEFLTYLLNYLFSYLSYFIVGERLFQTLINDPESLDILVRIKNLDTLNK